MIENDDFVPRNHQDTEKKKIRKICSNWAYRECRKQNNCQFYHIEEVKEAYLYYESSKEANLEVDNTQIMMILNQRAKNDCHLHFLLELFQEYPARPEGKTMN